MTKEELKAEVDQVLDLVTRGTFFKRIDLEHVTAYWVGDLLRIDVSGIREKP